MKKLIIFFLIILSGVDIAGALAVSTKPLPVKAPTTVVAKKNMLTPSRLTNINVSIGLIPMVLVPGGSFNMGGNDAGEDAKPVHKVKLKGFSIGKYEVTQVQWKAVMGTNPSSFHDCNNCPVENISWDDVQGFIKKLNQKTGKHYRLPTEAEWEYAARGGLKGKSYTYSGSNDLSSVAWNVGNSSGKTQPKGQKKPNSLGIFDMSGNVWEWCQDWYAADYYAAGPASNPQGPATGSFRVIRGGSWSNSAEHCLVAARESSFQGSRLNDLGFRLVLVP